MEKYRSINVNDVKPEMRVSVKPISEAGAQSKDSSSYVLAMKSLQQKCRQLEEENQNAIRNTQLIKQLQRKNNVLAQILEEKKSLQCQLENELNDTRYELNLC